MKKLLIRYTFAALKCLNFSVYSVFSIKLFNKIMKRFLLTIVVALACIAGSLAASHWTGPAIGTYNGTTQVYVKPMLNGSVMNGTKAIEIAAFIDGECRGVCSKIETIPDSPTTQYYMLLEVKGDAEDNGKKIEFRAFMDGVEQTYAKTSTFNVQGMEKYAFELDLISISSIEGISFKSPRYELEREATLDLNAELLIKINGENKAMDELPSCPVIVLTQTSNNISLVEGEVTAIASTNATGVKVTATVTGSDNLTTSTQIVVTPVTQTLDHIALPETVEVQRGASYNICEDVLFYYLAGINGDGSPMYTEVKYNELSETIKLEWSVSSQTAQNNISLTKEGLLNASASTDFNGVLVSVTLPDYPNIGAAQTKVLVTPISYEVTDVVFPDEIHIEVGETVDLADLVTFTVIIGVSADGAPIFDQKTSSEFNAPEINISGIYPQYATVDSSKITGVSGTTEEGETFTVNLTGTEFSGQPKLYITPYYVPLDYVAICINGVEVQNFNMVRGTTKEVTLKKVPENASYDLSKVYLDFQCCGDSSWWAGSSFVEKNISADGISRTLYAYLANSYKIFVQDSETSQTVNYDHEVIVNVGAPIHYESGWNWVSNWAFSSEMSTPDKLNTLIGDKLLDIRSQTQATYKDEIYGFFGPLKNISWGAYHLQTSESADFVVYPTFDKSKGKNDPMRSYYPSAFYTPWSWFYYPCQFDHTPAEIMVDQNQEPIGSEGDRIIGMDNGFAVMTDGEWVCNADFKLQAGQSYLYYAANGVPEGFKWVREDKGLTEMPESAFFDGSSSKAVSRYSEKKIWDYNAHQFVDNMTIVAVVDCEDDLSVGAFVGEECRGMGRKVEYNGQRYFFITVHGIADEKVSFQVYDGVEYTPLKVSVTFSDMVGSLGNPFHLGTFTTANGIENLENYKDEQQVYDLNGRRVRGEDNGFVIETGKVVFRR